ncbi:restriction endonuclease subunit M [Cryobacterium algoricola]|uniref:Restriction endonuclease subunit M n=1 Tax=Cryobacterium algoricola TaxID=1259183 RepID=A0ABY2ID62_9MICO|nr:DNA methyltransferase [Cryobacterium algoricola]TFB85835.1 restriction endonuclease subunit M [Cryobacterium algoricola]
MGKNELYFGDNLVVLKQYIKDESVDLVYLDPPFNSNRNYSVIFSRNGRTDDDNSAQIEAFEDTWTWTHATESQYNDFVATGPGKVVDALSAFRTLLGENDAMAYLVNMAPRLVELHRVLKKTGSLYLHCDPTMSHYLKILLDAIFDPDKFRSEIVWRRYGSHNDAKGYGAVHDTILFYSKGKNPTFNKQYIEYDEAYIKQRFRFEDTDGRRWMEQNLASPNPRPNLTYPYTASNGITYQPPANGWKVEPGKMADLDTKRKLHYPAKDGGRLRMKNYLDEGLGVPVQDVWNDIVSLGGTSPERLGYPTQKPVSLLERIIKSSTNPGDVVLDPFCGCGTAVDAAQRFDRQWIGIDVTYIAVDLIVKRLQHTYGDDIIDTFELNGIPKDVFSAHALFERSPFEFERWAVSLVRAEPNQKQVGDKGIDGVARFPLDGGGKIGKVLVSVKGGKTLNPAMVRDLKGTVETQKAQMGILVSLTDPTRGVKDAIDHGGVFTHPANGQQYPLLQHITIAELLSGKRPQMPPTLSPYIEAKKQKLPTGKTSLFDM